MENGEIYTKLHLLNLLFIPQLTFELEATRRAFLHETGSRKHRHILWGNATGQ